MNTFIWKPLYLIILVLISFSLKSQNDNEIKTWGDGNNSDDTETVKEETQYVKPRTWYRYQKPKKINRKKLKNLEKKLTIEFDFKDKAIDKDKMEYFTGYLINNTEHTDTIFQQDRSLIMIMEAKDTSDNWLPVECWFWSPCGNSYFRPLILEKSNAVSFEVPIYTGAIKTQFRLKLLSFDTLIYSKPFEGTISKEQLYEVIDFEKTSFWDKDIYLKKTYKKERYLSPSMLSKPLMPSE